MIGSKLAGTDVVDPIGSTGKLAASLSLPFNNHQAKPITPSTRIQGNQANVKSEEFPFLAAPGVLMACAEAGLASVAVEGVAVWAIAISRTFTEPNIEGTPKTMAQVTELNKTVPTP
ncbi:MAG: hypothetical protein NT070_20685 [Cyanobacteria bacterium]|nr:hypothetical protein [Cyanobacteriota bacterium]